MGFFDFLKPKKSGFDSMFKSPEASHNARFLLLRTELEQLDRHAANLKLLGRADEAKRRITEFMVEYVKFGRKRYASQRDISLICYHIAYKLLPELVYKYESTFEHLKSLGVPLPIYLALRGSLEQKTILDPKPLSKFTVSGGQIDSSVDYLLITFPPPPFISRQAMDAAKAKLMSGHMDQMAHAIPILAPHFACATFSNEGDKAVYVLGQMEEGGSNLRMVTADGANHNLDLGLGCDIEPEAFLAKIRDHLNPPPLPELSEERYREWSDYFAEKFPESFCEEDDEVESDSLENADCWSETEAASQIEVENPQIGQTMVLGPGIQFCGIEPGVFLMGSPENELGRTQWEEQTEVRISQGFWIAKYPCTQEQWTAVMGSNPSHFKLDGKMPVESISWDDAKKFCNELTKICRNTGQLTPGWEISLPSEAQWEFACRAGTSTALSNGKNLTSSLGACPNIDSIGWYKENVCLGDRASRKPPKVGQKAPNDWGLHDMHGCISEWCWDCMDPKKILGGTDPVGTWADDLRACRGGCWTSPPSLCRSAARFGRPKKHRSFSLGLRPVIVPIRDVDTGKKMSSEFLRYWINQARNS